MIATWMLYGAGIGLLLYVCARAAERLFHLRRRPIRWVWAGALALTAVAPAALYLAPAPTEFPFETHAVTVSEAPDAGRATSANSRAAPVPTPPRAAPIRIGDGTATRVWTGATLLVLLWGAVMYARLRRMRRAWTATEINGRSVLLSGDMGPAVVGFARYSIVLPEWVADTDPDARRLILEHEEEHMRAHDPRLLLAGFAVAALLPWNPAVWLQLSRLRVAVEVDCDARVLARGRSVQAYGALLLRVGRRRTLGIVPVAALSEPRSCLERRIRAMTRSRPRSAKLQAAACFAVSALAVLAACELPRPLAPGGARTAAQAVPVSEVRERIRPPAPEMQRRVLREIEGRHPDALDGLEAGQALWFVVDHDERVRTSWIGSTLVDGQFQRQIGERVPAGMHSPRPYAFELQGRGGATVPVVWAKEFLPWERAFGMQREDFDAIADTVARLHPDLFARGPRGFEAVWLYVRISSDPRTRSYRERVEETWVAPALATVGDRSHHVRARVPRSQEVGIGLIDRTVVAPNGDTIPVVWAYYADGATVEAWRGVERGSR